MTDSDGAPRSRVELRHLRYFVALAEELHFGRAAERLHISQPPLSQQIAALEKEIGVTLLRRTSRSVALTEAGRLFLAEARETLALAGRAVDLARRAATGEVGRVQVGFVPACGVIPAAVRRFTRRFPNVQLTLRHMASAEQLDALRRGGIDVGFVHLPIDAPDVACELVESHPLFAAVPARHPLSRRRRVSWRALGGETFIGFPRQAAPGAHDALMGQLRRAGLVPRIVHETDSILARLRMVAAGLGISLLPAYARNFNHAGVTLRPLGPPAAAAEIGVVHCPPRETPALGRFLEVVRETARARA
ncbi:MAG TPA: LysR substrate-binding domain-containing protein [Vicinamibacteria bacterium]|nr:LysR substrate-binding domain-containing protein [Vicinamibacteria bacterium]